MGVLSRRSVVGGERADFLVPFDALLCASTLGNTLQTCLALGDPCRTAFIKVGRWQKAATGVRPRDIHPSIGGTSYNWRQGGSAVVRSSPKSWRGARGDGNTTTHHENEHSLARYTWQQTPHHHHYLGSYQTHCCKWRRTLALRSRSQDGSSNAFLEPRSLDSHSL